MDYKTTVSQMLTHLQDHPSEKGMVELLDALADGLAVVVGGSACCRGHLIAEMPALLQKIAGKTLRAFDESMKPEPDEVASADVNLADWTPERMNG